MYQFDPGCTVKINLPSGLKRVLTGRQAGVCTVCSTFTHSGRTPPLKGIYFTWWNLPLSFGNVIESAGRTEILPHEKDFVLQLSNDAAVLFVLLIQAYINIINTMRNSICSSKWVPVRARLHKHVAFPFELVCSSERWEKECKHSIKSKSIKTLKQLSHKGNNTQPKVSHIQPNGN